MAVLRLCLCLSLAIVAINSLPITKERLRFTLSAKGLPSKVDTIDPYVEVFYTEGGNTREVKLGVTDAISNNENPEWSKIFEFDFDRNKHQKWHFKIWDKDHLRRDDKGGQVWVDVTDYVDKGQLIHSNLDKSGYLTVKAVDNQIQQRTQANTPGSLPYAPGSPDTGILTFRVSASGIKDKDKLGKTDPYTEIFYTNGLTGNKVKVGRTTTLSNTKDPVWGESFTFNWDRKKDQRLFFKIYDNDNLREDDTVGKAWLEVNDYVAKGQVMTVHLNKQGTLTLTRADGQPPNPYNPALAVNQPPQPPPFPTSPNAPSSQQNRQSVIVPNPGFSQPGFNSPLPINNQQQPAPGFQQPGHNAQFQQQNPQNFPAPGGFPQSGQNTQHQNHQNFPAPGGFPQSGQNTQHQNHHNVPAPGFSQHGQNAPFPANNPNFQQPSVAPTPTVAPTPAIKYPIKMRFILSGSGFPDKDLIGTSDPYVKVYISQDGLPETLLKKGMTRIDDENPLWDDLYEFNYDPAKHPKLRFLILDEDDNARDEEIGNVSMDASELDGRNYATLRLPVGSLTVRKV